ncbi:copper resistance D [Pseudomonas fluorescens]|uniref:Copper resistance protein D n=1 Tax=Pseudomonas fluorescens TaxID=294 RepID=A0A379IAE6_PSEFL|nr:copper homeostasis membrane protein CopD [Pseudomonas fluorescens]AIG05369.1 copper resistance protein CopD [Pseudomonas fluorescens]SUD29716.1 copper resistance D [Pseudomonas fluorescens]
MSDSLGIALRFALYLDLMLLFGLGLFGLYGLKAAERQPGVVLNFKGWLAGTAAVGVLLSVLSLLWMTWAMSGVEQWQALGPHLQMMLWQTELGLTWMLRIGALLVAAVAVFLSAGSLWLPTLGGAIALSTLAWAGHGAMDDGALRLWHLGSASVHLLAAGAWVGALAAFGLLLLPCNMGDAQRVRVLTRAVAGFEVVGTVVVVVLIVTGVVNYLFIVGPTLQGIASSTYGLLFSLKLALFGGMLAMAALNRWRLGPLLQRAVDAGDYTMARRALRRSMQVECGAVLLILGLVAWLGTLGPMASD